MNKTLPNTKKSWAARLLNPFVAIPLLILFLLLCAPFAYRGYKLSLVPDPGEPFDVAAFIKASQVDDADNALFDFQKAISLRGAMLDIDDWDQIFEELLSENELSQEAQDLIIFIEANEPALLAFKKGTLKSEFCEIPVDKLSYKSSFPVTQQVREFVRLFVARALLETQKGNYEEAANWYLACFRAARLVKQNGPVLPHMIAKINYAFATDNLIKNIRAQQFPREILEKLCQELSEINADFSPASGALKSEYISFMNLVKYDMEDFYRESFFDNTSPSIIAICFYVVGDPEISVSLMRQWHGNLLPEIDRPRPLRPHYDAGSNPILLYEPSPPKLNNRKQLTPAEIDKVWRESILYRLFNPLMAYFVDTEDKFQIRKCLLVTILQLEIYHRKHGSYPAKLEDACPDGKVPIDVFDPAGAPLRYKKEADGSCKVWSVGKDGVDDGGLKLGFEYDDTDYGYYLGMKKNQSGNTENDPLTPLE